MRDRNARFWTPQEDETLTYQWNILKNSGNHIAEVLGRTKDSIVGRAHRLKLDKRPSPIAARLEGKRLHKKNGDRRLTIAEAEQRIAETACLPAKRQVDENEPRPEHNCCQWLDGDPKHRRFCGKPTHNNSSWCEEHYRVVFVRQEKPAA